MAGGSKVAVYTAVAVNVLITVVKFAGFFMSGSGAMLSEAIHSLADAGNQGLLALGMKRAERPADATHPFGYGREGFVWALISAAGIFFLGAGVTVAHGVDTLFEGATHQIEGQGLALGILVFSLILEGVSFATATKGMRDDARARGLSLIQHLRTTDDPFGIAVMLEDAAAVLGVVIAFVAIGLSMLTHHPYWDAIGSILVGALLALLAVFLISKNRSLIIGRAIQPADQAKIDHIFASDPAVEAVSVQRGLVTGANSVRITAEIDLDGRYLARKALEGRDLGEIRAQLTDPDATQAWLEEFGETITTLVGSEIDRIEDRIREQIPSAKTVDIEPH